MKKSSRFVKPLSIIAAVGLVAALVPMAAFGNHDEEELGLASEVAKAAEDSEYVQPDITLEEAAAIEAAEIAEAESAEPAMPETASEIAESAKQQFAEAEGSYAEGEMLVVYEAQANSIGLNEEVVSETGETTTLASIGVVEEETVVDGDDDYATESISSVKLDEGASIEEALDEIAQLPGVAYVQPNYKYELAVVPNDPSVVNGATYYLSKTNTLKAWDKVKTNGAVTIATIDSGCRLDHEDIAGNIEQTLAYDAISKKSLSSARVEYNGDSSGHGTAVAGVAAAVANNSKGIAGVSYNARLIPIRAFDSPDGDIGGTTTDVMNALNHIEAKIKDGSAKNLKVVNMSFGSTAANANDNTIHNKIKSMRTIYGITFVAAGGNGSGSSPFTAASYPSDWAEVISVTSLDRNGANSVWSDYNANKDISAPGEGMYMTYNGAEGNLYGTSQGTSFATPIVSGVAALLYAADPTATPDQVKAAIKNTATPVTGNAHSASGSKGAVDAYSAVMYILGESSKPDTKPAPEPSSNPGVATPKAMYRLLNPKSGEHLYSTDVSEVAALEKAGWKNEDVAWYSPSSSTVPIYRVFNPKSGEHHYTTDNNEMVTLAKRGWNYEGIGLYSAENKSVPVYRMFNQKTGAHLYTKDAGERDALEGAGWKNEGVCWYGLRSASDNTPITEKYMYRVYNKNSREHLYTGDSNEYATLVKNGWDDEDVAWVAPSSSTVPVYRVFNPRSGEHVYTADANEMITLSKNGWNYEGVCWFSDPDRGLKVYRLFHQASGLHHYTADDNERSVLINKQGWKSEDIAWYGIR